VSAWGYSRPKWAVRATSAFPPVATVLRTSPEDRFVPEPEMSFLTASVLIG